MSNQDVITKILEEDGDLIIYRKSLRKITGSVTSAILLQQMMHRCKGKDKIYKFYGEGDAPESEQPLESPPHVDSKGSTPRKPTAHMGTKTWRSTLHARKAKQDKKHGQHARNDAASQRNVPGN